MKNSPFKIGESWEKVLVEELQKPYLANLASFVKQERASGKEVYPPEDLVFDAFKQTPFEKVKVLVMGQDPYHGPGQAHGLSFSVKEGVKTPPSLKNIYKELTEDVDFTPSTHGCLLSWAKQGVMLLNATLTVQKSQPMSHQGRGWELFTDAVVKKLAEREDPLVFVLWGMSAKKKCSTILSHHRNREHLILEAAHPSPFSARNGFFGCQHFSKINHFLEKKGKAPVNWNLPITT